MENERRPQRRPETESRRRSDAAPQHRRSAAAQRQSDAPQRQTDTPQQRRKPETAAAQPQKRKKKRVRTIPNTGLRWKLLTMAAVVAAIIIGFTIFFKVQHIEVRGNKYYTAQEVAAVCGVEAGDNLLTVSKETVAAHITAELPYISEVQVKRSLPNTLVLTVSEFDVSYSVQDSAGAWWLISRNGTVLESTNEKTAKTHIVINGLIIAPPEIGTKLIVDGSQIDEEDDELSEEEKEKAKELAACGTAVIKLLQEMELRPFAKQIVSVDATASYDLSLWYGTRYQIRLGICDQLEEKFNFLEVVLEKLEPDNLEGVVDITFSEDKNVRFQPFRQN